jgi:hypothetical protein
MAEGHLESKNFDRYLLLSEKAASAEAIAANLAFERALVKAIKRGREIVTQGTFVDHTPSYARLYRGEAPMSVCGSPAAMCFDSGGLARGADVVK